MKKVSQVVMAPSHYYPGIYLEALRKIMKALSQNSPCSGRDSDKWVKQYIKKCRA
jgi:hypothetical protein